MGRNPLSEAAREYFRKTGAEGGKKGGKARTAAKLRAARANVARAREFLLTQRVCKVCRKRRLRSDNKSGICRVCQRASKSRG